MLEGDRLRLEVRIEEIDPDSITFPPVGLTTKRSEGGLYLDIDLKAVAADRDRDGLTDIAERRLGLDFAKEDSDGDGLPDGGDPLPLTAYRRDVSPLDSEMARAILAQIKEHDAGAIMVQPSTGSQTLLEDFLAASGSGGAARAGGGAEFLVSDDPDLFAGITPPYRFMVYSSADMEALSRGAAPFYAPEIMDVFTSLDRKRRYVSWSARWTGGAFEVNCTEPGVACKVKVHSQWIT
jgi:hypothetical protein